MDGEGDVQYSPTQSVCTALEQQDLPSGPCTPSHARTRPPSKLMGRLPSRLLGVDAATWSGPSVVLAHWVSAGWTGRWFWSDQLSEVYTESGRGAPSVIGSLHSRGSKPLWVRQHQLLCVREVQVVRLCSLQRLQATRPAPQRN